VVTDAGQHGTIGGGQLELRAIAIARNLLADGGTGALRRFPLGASLGQCCGGVVNLVFEAVSPAPAEAAWLDQVQALRGRGEPCILVSPVGRPASAGAMVVARDECEGSCGAAGIDAAAAAHARRMLEQGDATALAALPASGETLFLFDPVRPPELEVVLFGAGHVARALVPILASLPCRIHWIDERADAFPAAVPPGDVRIIESDDPVAEVAAARAGACFLVMTHSHALDEALTQAILARGDFRWFGLIGSLTKRRRFEHRLGARGIDAAALARMTCPIGIGGIADKAPATIAVAVAAQLLRERERWRAAPPDGRTSSRIAGSRERSTPAGVAP
jgi:xanthine dehydrogenase accessory factor